MKKLIILPILFFLSGCYTQLAIDERPNRDYNYGYKSENSEDDYYQYDEDNYSDTLYDSKGNIYNLHFYNYPFGFRKYYSCYYPRIYLGFGTGYWWYHDPFYWSPFYYDSWFYPTIIYPIGYWYTPYYWYPKYYWNFYRIDNYSRSGESYKLRNSFGLRNSSGIRNSNRDPRDFIKDQLKQRERNSLTKNDSRITRRDFNLDTDDRKLLNRDLDRKFDRNRNDIDRNQTIPPIKRDDNRMHENERKNPNIKRDYERRQNDVRENKDNIRNERNRRDSDKNYNVPNNNSTNTRTYSPPRDNSPRQNSTPPPRNDGGRNQSGSERNRR